LMLPVHQLIAACASAGHGAKSRGGGFHLYSLLLKRSIVNLGAMSILSCNPISHGMHEFEYQDTDYPTKVSR
jgi:hypothetical protein